MFGIRKSFAFGGKEKMVLPQWSHAQETIVKIRRKVRERGGAIAKNCNEMQCHCRVDHDNND